ncbi:Acetyl-CoA decarbonylase/synthase complex, gamma subunit [Moorella glycerini]|uniref:Corrinoid/iron-sulfur protein large subunit n=1 Tax=Neomoorella stamsii TaxID=1266720 RepID=A0A9X7J162_9FIRM|nr:MULTISPECIES: acetyl-CoA decarbonylase/synthase complex subunit gamma [Moorella]PRR71363.1 Corrinoid/iron-sulfur protein large subunit [Moorella stamsii]CEP66609.1 Acetyl-CoA decarbonylase/synthase complex, gamma subunit [Moorella glycerini]CEP68571.1 Acetyl-CoA decarbonylase/synthase complex, gamma subunit [Moorella glycerini]
MALTGLEIYKQLPKKNCGECGTPTCLAFAMNLAAGKASLDSCPYVSDAAREALNAAAAPPIAKVVLGTGTAAVEMGDETELFRHDKRFYHETAIAIQVSDNLSNEELMAKVAAINELQFDRVGQHYTIQAIAIRHDADDPNAFQAAVAAVAAATRLNLILMANDAAVLKTAVAGVADRKPLLYAATAANYEAMTTLAKEFNCPLAVYGNGLEELAGLVDKIVALGCKQLVLDPGARETSRAVADFTQIRRLAIKKRFRSFGYPIIALTTAGDPLAEILQATNYISKYASLVVLRTAAKEHLLPLLSWRQNLYTDPQVPIRVEEKLNEIGAVNENSPVYVTTNFSLTYYSVEGEIESTKIPSYLLSVDTDGLSVLTAYADGKFEAEKIAGVMKKVGLENKVKHRRIIIPGAVAVLKGKLEDLTGWEVLVGPREASGIVAFARANLAS